MHNESDNLKALYEYKVCMQGKKLVQAAKGSSRAIVCLSLASREALVTTAILRTRDQGNYKSASDCARDFAGVVLFMIILPF